ncbi:hypothetical protein WICPIJ_009270 [Wickerhamomyces pijperi]|uniref:Uncharacterized protein n=1 Tax=Wickerhamomyces pijperi TaxID=599730 RepID=A0A9P8PPQ8_WICPI|nr:hypothetical protein WICPIJ_009270 [Wickerhamomyces pijperi]
MLRRQTSQLIFRRSIKTLYQEISHGNNARQSILRGASKLHDAVSVTLGPRGRNVLMEQKYNFPKITKDGFSVANEIYVSDKFEALGVQLMKDIISKTNLQAGDGTTTTTVLAYEILKRGVSKVSLGCNPLELRKGIELGVKEALKFLHERKIELTRRDDEQLRNIAVISCNGDQKLGSLIYEGMKTIGENGILTIEENNKVEDEVVVKSGLRFNEGYIHEHFANNDIKTKKVELTKPLVLLHKGTLINSTQMLPILNYARVAGRPLLIITDALEGDALAIAALNKLQRQVQVCVVKSPGYADHRSDNLKDLELLTNSQICDADLGEIASQADPKYFGLDAVDSAIITNNETVLITNKSKLNRDAITQRIAEIKEILDNTPNMAVGDKDHTQRRLANLSIDSNATATVKVGGHTKFEIKEKKDRLDDALNSTQSAVKYGIIPGGGIALFKASAHLATLDVSEYSFDVKQGVQIITDALQSPLLRLLSNSQHPNHLQIITSLLTIPNTPENFTKGININTAEVGIDMLEQGIVDPVWTVECALRNAAAVTSLMCSTEVVIGNEMGEREYGETKVGGGRTKF